MSRPKMIIMDKESKKAQELMRWLSAEKNRVECESRWILSGNESELKGVIRGWPAKIVVTNDPNKTCEEHGVEKDEVIFVSNVNGRVKGRTVLNFFTLSGDKGRSATGANFPYSLACSDQDFKEANLRSFWYDLTACYFGPLLEKRKALGIPPWGLRKGMRECNVGSLKDVMFAFASPFSNEMYIPNGDKKVTVHLVLCPNYREDRTGVTTSMIAHKLDSYVNFLASIINLAPSVDGINFYSLNGQSLDIDIFKKLINPKALHRNLNRELNEMFSAYRSVFVDRLSGLIDREGAKINFTSIQEAFPEAGSWGINHIENKNSALLDAITEKVILNSPAAIGQSYSQVRERTAGDLALSLTTAKKIGENGVMLDTDFHKKSYWEPMFPALQAVNPKFSLFLLPGYFSHNLAYV